MKIEVEIPDNVWNFLKALVQCTGADPQEYIRDYIADDIEADLSNIGNTPFWNKDELEIKYGLKKSKEELEKEFEEHSLANIQPIHLSKKQRGILEVAANAGNMTPEEYCQKVVLSALEDDLESGAIKTED